MKKRGLFIFSILLVFICVSLCSCSIENISFNEYKASRYVDPEKYQIGSFTYQNSDVEYIDIEWGPKDINIIQTNSDVLSVFETGELSDNEKMRYLIENKVLKIKFWKSEYSATVEKNTKEITVEIPANVSLSVSTISGNLKSTGFTVNELEFKSTSGDIYAGDVVANSVKIGTVSGNTRFESLKTESIKASSTSGNLNAKIIDVSSIDFDTVSGDMNLNLKKNTGFILKYMTVSGDLVCNEAYEKNGYTYSYLDKKIEMSADSTSGDITIGFYD